MKKQKQKQQESLNETAKQLNKMLTLDNEELFEKLKTKSYSDLSSRSNRLKSFGSNKRVVKKFNFFKEYLKSLFEPFNILLLVIGVTELLIWGFYFPEGVTRGSLEKVLDLVSALIIFLMVILASVVDFIQEYIAFNNSAKLLQLISNEVFLVNQDVSSLKDINGELLIHGVVKVQDSSLTKGDLVYLKTGDIIPTDMKIIWSENLYVDQSSLTGEADPIYKTAESKPSKTIFEANNLLISDTTIVQGKVLGLVLTIGSETYANKIVSFSEETNDKTDYELGLRKVTKIILFMVIGAFPVVFLISGWRTGKWVSSVIFAISMVVSLIPESLPAILSSNLQVGSKKMAEEQIVIKNFKAVQNLGSTTVIATDKTGTLTTGKLEVIGYVDANFKTDEEVLKQTYFSVYFQNNLANQIDDSINSFWKENLLPFNFSNFELLESIEFDFETRLTSVLLKEGNENIQITKGAPKEVLSLTTLTKDQINQTLDYIHQLENDGKKAIAVAKKVGLDHIVTQDLEFCGLIIFINQIKPGVKKVIKMFDDYSLDLKILTGDSSLVAAKTGQELGLINTRTIEGQKFSQFSEPQKLDAVREFGIFAKLNPLEKVAVVSSLQQNGQVVTYLGDGINDVPALKKADVGISVNNGSATAKATSDVILLKKDLGILETGIIEGRKIFTNAIKFIKIVVTMNFGLLVTILIGSFWFDFNAMSPIQLLLQNLFYDFMNLAFVFDNVDAESIKKPHAWNPKNILTFGLYNGIVPVIISLTNFAIVGYGFGLVGQIQSATGDAQLHLIQQFQTAFFLESLTTHIVLVVVYRTEEWSLIQSRPSLTLALVLLGFIGLGFLFVYTPGLNETLGYHPMANNWWLMVYFSYYILAYLLGELSKWSYKKIFRQWI